MTTLFKRKSKPKPKAKPKAKPERKSRRKPKPAKTAKPAPDAAPRGIAVSRRPLTIDTVLLGIALFALSLGCLLLLLEIYQYGGFGSVKGPM